MPNGVAIKQLALIRSVLNSSRSGAFSPIEHDEPAGTPMFTLNLANKGIHHMKTTGFGTFEVGKRLK